MQFRARVHTTMSSSSSLLSPPSPRARSALYLSANPPGPPLSGVARSRSRKGDAGSRGDGRGRRAAPSCACRVSSAAGCGEPGGAGGGVWLMLPMTWYARRLCSKEQSVCERKGRRRFASGAKIQGESRNADAQAGRGIFAPARGVPCRGERRCDHGQPDTAFQGTG